MAWVYLLLAAISEIGWPLGLKIAGSNKFIGLPMAIIFMALSGFLLYLAQRTIPIGIAYAVWTSVGAAGTFLVGVIYYKDPSSFVSYLGIGLILIGVICLKLGVK